MSIVTHKKSQKITANALRHRAPSRSHKRLRLAEDLLRLASRLATAAYGLRLTTEAQPLRSLGLAKL
jgi:TRAP-type C4-dicarboxylate transport system permease small subunit